MDDLKNKLVPELLTSMKFGYADVR